MCKNCNTTFLGISSDYCSSICRNRYTYVSTSSDSKYRINRGRRIDKNLLDRLYVEQKKSARQVAKETGFSEPTVRKQLREMGIPIRDRVLQLEISRTL